MSYITGEWMTGSVQVGRTEKQTKKDGGIALLSSTKEHDTCERRDVDDRVSRGDYRNAIEWCLLEMARCVSA